MYLPIFEAAVKEAVVGAVMSSYNLTNGEHMSANRRLADVLKQEWGFPGVLMSDWGAVHSTLGAANGGTDLEMPGPQYFNRDSLLPLVQQGRVSPATIDDKVRRLLRNIVRFGWMDRPQLDPSIPRHSQTGRQAALEGARGGPRGGARSHGASQERRQPPAALPPTGPHRGGNRPQRIPRRAAGQRQRYDTNLPYRELPGGAEQLSGDGSGGPSRAWHPQPEHGRGHHPLLHRRHRRAPRAHGGGFLRARPFGNTCPYPRGLDTEAGRTARYFLSGVR